MSKQLKQNHALLSSIISKCQETTNHPSQINRINEIIETYLKIEVSSDDGQVYSDKLDSFLAMCKLVEVFAKKAVQAKNNTLVVFLQQKANILIQILVSSELSAAIRNQQEFQIVAETLCQILTSLDQANSQAFAQKFVSRVILQKSGDQTQFNTKMLSVLYQSMTKSTLISHLLLNINQKLEEVTNIQDKKCIQSLSAFFINLPPFDIIEMISGQANSQNIKQKSFEEQLQEQKPKQEFKKLFQSSFLKLLSLIESHRDIAVGLYRKLDSKIMSKMNNPLILSDYFLNRFKQQSQIQIEVLSCLFILVGKYGLQFQNFYPRLQALIKQKKDGKSVYQMQNSKRFFKLVQTALRSSKVPFKTIQTITRSILSQIMQEESEFSFWALAFFFNLTKKHRKLLDLIKQIPELQLMSKHYNPKIRSLVSELRRDLNKAEYLDIQKFSKIDCKKLTQKKVEELGQKLNRQQEAQFKIPGLFEDL